MLTVLYGIIYLLIFAIGATIGSFLNVLVYRLPRNLDFVKGFSFCPKCEHRLKPLDLVPILSWLFLKGRCRYCGEKISPRYLIVEAVSGAAGLLLYVYVTPPERAVLFFAIFCVLLTMALIDADTQTISDGMNIALGVLAVISIWVGPEVGMQSRLIGLAAVSVPLFVITLFIDGAFGLGDVFLMISAGFLLGWQGALVALFIGLLIGGVYGAYVLIRRKKGRKDHFAFGPCLAVGIFASLLCGQEIIYWYLSMF
ncbi:MAG: prepilin peptidase [Clostridiales Family XIII bacterium]|nr:prepilin peptidase [Clostridiales Family XIII bacterium]